MPPKTATNQQILDSVNTLISRIDGLESRLGMLEEMNEKLVALTEDGAKKEKRIALLESRLDSLEVDRRRTNAVVLNIPEELTDHKALIKHISDTSNQSITPASIYRTKSRSGKSGPVIIRFCQVQEASEFIRKSRGTSLVVKRDLPPAVQTKNRNAFLDKAVQFLVNEGKAATIANNAIHIDGKPIDNHTFREMTNRMFNK